MRFFKCSLIAVFVALPSFAADPSVLPDKPVPVEKPRTADREFLIEAGSMGAAWTFDAVTTHDVFAANAGYHEVGNFFPGSRSTAKVMGAWAAVDVAAAVVAYEWKGHVKNRYLHPLWRVPMALRATDHVQAGIGNVRLLGNVPAEPSRTLPVPANPITRFP
jgi:hypothetical protein